MRACEDSLRRLQTDRIDLYSVKPVPERDRQGVRIALEEDAVFAAGRLQWLLGRQTQLHLIR
jgi:aryl-alcohol dehydrogenase-like predicted oxidoreductase